jgi:hypothetical protein
VTEEERSDNYARGIIDLFFPLEDDNGSGNKRYRRPNAAGEELLHLIREHIDPYGDKP